MRARVPTSLANNEYEAFPEGFYSGQISGAEVRDPNGDGSWLTLRLSTSEITPLEGTADPQRSRFNGDITVRTDGVDVREVEDFSDRDLPYPIRQAGGLLAGLAIGLGVATEEGGMIDFETDAVLNALTEGEFEGELVSFQIGHWETKDGTTRDQYVRFGAA